jgi:hypothetical protein
MLLTYNIQVERPSSTEPGNTRDRLILAEAAMHYFIAESLTAMARVRCSTVTAPTSGSAYSKTAELDNGV